MTSAPSAFVDDKGSIVKRTAPRSLIQSMQQHNVVEVVCLSLKTPGSHPSILWIPISTYTSTEVTENIFDFRFGTPYTNSGHYLQLWIDITKSSTDLLIPAKPRRMCSYVADPVRSLCVHRKNGSPGTAAHSRNPTLHLLTLGFQCFNQRLVDTSFPHGRGRFPMVEVGTQCSELSPSYSCADGPRSYSSCVRPT